MGVVRPGVVPEAGGEGWRGLELEALGTERVEYGGIEVLRLRAVEPFVIR